MLSGRLRGGFLASSLPPHRLSSSSSISEDGDTNSSDYIHQSSSGQEAEGYDTTSVMRMLRSIHEKLATLEEKQVELTDTFKELHSIVRKQEKESFNIKGSSFEAPLKEEMAKLFCHSLTRNPSDGDVQHTKALKYCKTKLTEFHSEERRKVLGHVPYSELCYRSTRELGELIMQQMHCPPDVDEEKYIRHLAILRKFVRLALDDKEATYTTLREWLGSSSISEERWATVMEEDIAFDYNTSGVGCESIEVVTEDDIPYEREITGIANDEES